MEIEYKQMLVEIGNHLKDEDIQKMKFTCSSFIKKKENENIDSAVNLWEALEHREKLGPKNLQLLKSLLTTCTNDRIDLIRIVEKYEYISGIGQNQGISPPIAQGQGYVMMPQQFPQGFGTPGMMPQQFPHGYGTPGMMPPQFPQGYGMTNGYMAQPEYPNLPIPQKMVPEYRGPDLQKEVLFLKVNLGREWRFLARQLGVPDMELLSLEDDYPRNSREQIYQCLWKWLYREQENASRQKLIAALKDTAVQRNDLAYKLESQQY